MSKRRKHGREDDSQGSSTDTSRISPLRSNPPALESDVSLISSDLSFNPIVEPQPLPWLTYELAATTHPLTEGTLDVGSTMHPLTLSQHHSFPAWPQSVPTHSDVTTTAGPSSVTGIYSEQLFTSTSSIRSECTDEEMQSSSSLSISSMLQDNIISDTLPEQPLPSIESHVPQFNYDNPTHAFESFDLSGQQDDHEMPFHDAVETQLHELFANCEMGINQRFLEENDPLHQTDEVEENAECPALCEATDLFFDALDSEPLDKGDLPSSDPPLYDGATVSVNEALTAVLTFMLGCRVSGEVMDNLISLINLLLPASHKFVPSLFSFFKFFESIKSPPHLIYYCTVCTQTLETKDTVCDKCTTDTKVGFYLYTPLIAQLKCLYARPGFADLLSYRHKRTKQNSENIEDIYDGSVYKSVEHLLTSPLDITLSWNADGISLYKSSNYQVWPMYFSINELPPELRHKEENLLLGGIAFGYEKPHANILMKPIYEELQQLREGVDMAVHGREDSEKVKCLLLCGTADAPAKSTFMRIIQFNGHHGCHCCYAKGEKSDRTEQVFVYPFEENLRPRSKESYCEDLKTLSNGVKGPTYLFWMVVPFFMLSTAIDVMHCVYLGVCRQLFTLWFHKKYFKLVFGENADKEPLLDALSKQFCSFRAPHYFDRPPRSLKHVKYFKASEFRTWLFSTALPVFEKHMKEPYFTHFKKLVCGVALLNQASVSTSDIQLSRDLLTSFVRQFQDLFGLRNMSYNVHCLLHLADSVVLLGPLWATSCFQYENINGLLARLVHGTRYAGCQMQNNLGLLRKIPSMINSLQNNIVKSYCTKVMSYRRKLSVTLKLALKTFVIGKIVRGCTYNNLKHQQILQNLFPNKTLNFFFRLRKDGFLYVAEEYGRGMRDSSNVLCKFENGRGFGSLKIFVRVTDCFCENPYCNHPSWCYALIQRYVFSYPFKIITPAATISTIVSVVPIDEFCVVEVSDLHAVCFKMVVSQHSNLLSIPVNQHEME